MDNNQLERFIRDNAGAFDTRTPDPAVLSRILQQMEGGAAQKEKTPVIRMRIVRMAAACLILLAGAAVLWVMMDRKETSHETVIAKAPATAAAPETTATADVAALPGKESQEIPAGTEEATAPAVRTIPVETHAPVIAGNRQLIFAGLRDMEAPSQRMEAASRARKLPGIDHDIIDALSTTLNSDPNTNVRLAALEALGKFQRESYVKKKLIESLKKQNDPMVQIALIDMLTTIRERKILQELDKIVNDKKTIDAVKDHAYSSIFTLRS